MREVYLPAFEAAVKDAKVGSLMTSYNLVNGVHRLAVRSMITDIAKKEWGFDGVVDVRLEGDLRRGGRDECRARPRDAERRGDERQTPPAGDQGGHRLGGHNRRQGPANLRVAARFGCWTVSRPTSRFPR